MTRTALVTFMLTGALIGTASAAHADPRPPRTATSLTTATATVSGGQHLALGCDFTFDAERQGMVLFAVSISNGADHTGYTMTMNASTGSYVDVEVGGFAAAREVSVTERPDGTYIQAAGFRAPHDGTLQAGVATWGTLRPNCGVLVDDVEIGPWSTRAPERAVVAYASDFTGTASAETQICALFCDTSASASVARSYARHSEGSLFAVFATAPFAARAVRIDGPNGEVRESVGIGLTDADGSGPGAAVYGIPTSGTWTYTATAYISPIFVGPLLWVMEL